MGFPDLLTDAGVAALNDWLSTRSFVEGDAPSQGDITVFKALKAPPNPEMFPHAAKWYGNIVSYENSSSTLPGDANKPYSAYGPGGSDEDENVDLFNSDDEEDPEAEKVRQQRLEEYRKKKEAKPKTAAKSIVIMDIKPWDDETDMVGLEAAIRAIEKDGLVWGASQLIPIGFGIHKLQINMVVEDDKVSPIELQDEIQELEDYVQSSDIAAMQKL